MGFCSRAIVGGVGSDGVAETDAHRCVSAGVKTEAGMGNREDRARDVHCVCAFGDVDGAALVCRGKLVDSTFDGGEGAGVGHGQGGGSGFSSGGGKVLFGGGVEVLSIWGILGVVPGAESGGELRDDSCEVAQNRDGGGSGTVAAEFFGGDVDLDELGAGVPFGGVAEVEDPVQAGAEDEDDVGFF